MAGGLAHNYLPRAHAFVTKRCLNRLAIQTQMNEPLPKLLHPTCMPHRRPGAQVGPVYHSPERSAPLLEAAYRNSLRVRCALRKRKNK